MAGKYHDLIGLVEFGDEAYVVTPFTSDYENILLSLSLIGDWTEFMKFPDQGTTIGLAIPIVPSPAIAPRRRWIVSGCTRMSASMRKT